MNTLTQHQLEEGLTDKDKQTTFLERAKARLSDKPTTEYRFENTDTGQGHYFTDLTDCLEAARSKSKESPAATFLIEHFRPERLSLATIKDNILTFTPEEPPQPTPRFTNEQWQLKACQITFDNLADYLHRKGVMTESLYDELLLESEYETRNKFGERPVETEKPFTGQTSERTDPTVNLHANLEALEAKISEAYATLQTARSRIYEAKELTCTFPYGWKALTEIIDNSLDILLNLSQRTSANKKKALAPTRQNQSSQGE